RGEALRALWMRDVSGGAASCALVKVRLDGVARVAVTVVHTAGTAGSLTDRVSPVASVAAAAGWAPVRTAATHSRASNRGVLRMIRSKGTNLYGTTSLTDRASNYPELVRTCQRLLARGRDPGEPGRDRQRRLGHVVAGTGQEGGRLGERE